MCLVTIGVPPEAASTTVFQVDQAAEDVEWPLITVQPGTTVYRINIGAWWKPQRNIGIFVDRATIAGTIGGRMMHGDVRAANATLNDISVEIVEEGSFYLLDIQAKHKHLSVNYRNAENRLCVGSDMLEGSVWAQRPETTYAKCDISGVVDGSDYSNWFSYTMLRGTYDKDGDMKVTKDEFTAGLSSMRCCGGACPYEAWCERESYALGFADTGQFGLTLADFALRLQRTNNSNWMPWCMSSLQLNGHGLWPGRTQAFSHLHSEKGEIVISLKQTAEPRRPIQPFNTTFRAVGARPAGLKILEADAARLRAAYGVKYGDRGSTESIFLVIEVVGGGGYPPSRWYYATNPAMLVLMPSLLHFVSAGMLMPQIVRERVRFVDNDCAFGKATYNETYKNETLLAMATGLKRSLLSSAYDYGDLRGALVLGDGEVGGLHFPSLVHVAPGLPARLERWDNPFLSSTLTLSVVLSACFGAIMGLLLTAVLYRVMHMVHFSIWQQAQANRAVVMSKMGYDEKTMKEMAEKERADNGDEGRGGRRATPSSRRSRC